jgi:predicted flap endonuclease-1-like 5' DNA nuclease
VTKGNATMAVAATAKGTAKAAAAAAPEDKNRPAGIAKPAQPDDLKMISGVGPKIEGILHSLGIYTFAQVASWKKAEREWLTGISIQGPHRARGLGQAGQGAGQGWRGRVHQGLRQEAAIEVNDVS